MRHALRTAITMVTALVLTAPAASADIFAITQGAAPAPRTDIDLVKVDASTGALATLPAGINTTASELHPSVSADGNRIVFERTSPTGTDRILMANLSTGQTADLYNGFEVATIHPTSPAITPDGKAVLTGGPFQTLSGHLFSAVTLTDVTTFPTGPYAHNTYEPQYAFGGASGLVENPVATGADAGSLIAFAEQSAASPQRGLILGQIGGAASNPLANQTDAYDDPTIGAPGGSPTVVFDHHAASVTGAPTGPSDLAFRPATVASFSGRPTPLPSTVNTSLDERRPALTPDGRYLGFIRTGTDGRQRLFVWDSQTQTLINSAGVDLPGSRASNLSLYVQFVFTATGVSPTGTVSFNLLQSSGVGILVQRVVGHHKLFGHTVPALNKVGRVPLGKFATGRRHVHWDLRVNRHRLAPGTYQVTVRAITPHGKIRDFGEPRIIHVHAKPRWS